MKKKIVLLHLTGGPLIKKEFSFNSSRNQTVLAGFTEGGLFHALSALSLLTKNYEITILCLNPPGFREKQEIYHQGIKILCLGNSTWIKWAQFGNFAFFKEVYKYIKKINPDILIGNNLLASFLINFFPKNIKKIGIIHHLYLTHLSPNQTKELKIYTKIIVWIIKCFERLALNFLKLQGIGVINPLVRDVLIKRKYPKNKIVVVGNGINISFYSFSEKKVQNSLIYIGRIAELKGVENLINVVLELKKEIPQIILHLVGQGPQYENIKKKIKKLGLENNVLLWKYLNEKEKINLLEKSALYLSASQFEGFGLPLIEAMATGCVPVVSDIYAHSFVFQGRKVGYLIKDNKEMIEKILKLLKNEKERLELAREGRKLVEEMWVQEKLSQRYQKLLQI